VAGARDSSEDLVTVEEAARRLGVSQSQVHNLCKGAPPRLIKVPAPTGRKNHPAHAAVITRESLEELLRHRSSGPDPLETSPTQPAGESASRAQQSAGGHGAIHTLKVQLDQAREQWRKERLRSARLATLLERTAAELRSAVESREPFDEIADAYSAALTELLVEDDPGSMT